MGIEPTYPAWKAGVLPLNYTRKIIYNCFKKSNCPPDIQAGSAPAKEVDATRFELATSASRTQRSTKLSHASPSSFSLFSITSVLPKVKNYFKILKIFLF